jgi:hypothetical protein
MIEHRSLRVSLNHRSPSKDRNQRTLRTTIHVPLPPDRKTIDTKWVYKVKVNADGTGDRYKARLVAKGYSQTQGIDFNETFSPVAKFNSLRCVLSVAAFEDLELHQLDVNTAFLYGIIEEEIFSNKKGYRVR